MFQHGRVSAGDAALGVRFAGQGPNRLAVAGRLAAGLTLASGPIKVLVPTRIGVILGRRKEFRHDRSVLVI
jgi:hypothetical protein